MKPDSIRRYLFLLLSAALAVAALSLPPALPAQDAPVAMGDTSLFRPLDLPAPNQYRSASGKPGPSYWQQRADYRIEATLDPATQTIRGTETIRYRNNSPDSLRFVWLQMDQNLYRPDSKGSFLSPGDSRWGARDFQGGYTVAYTRVGGKPVEAYIRDTMMRLDLPRPLAPGGSTEIAVGWSFPIPEHGSDRLARQGELYEIAQWFPRMAVFDDVSGWNTDPYLGQGEFYREFGDYDVSLTVPANYIVAATGTLRNPGEVLTSAQRERLARAARDTAQVSIIAAGEVGTPGTRPRQEGTQTWRFRAENVADFAWAASPNFRWDAESWNGVTCHALYEPDATAWVTAADMTCHSVREFSRWYPYPYPQATSIAGPVGGMEYPMFVFVHADGDEQSVYGTIAHEHGHNWFPMIVHNNERRYAWMDEGFNTFIDTWANDTRFPGTDTRAVYRRRYDVAVADGTDRPIMTPPDRLPRTSLGIAAYRKPAMSLHLLRDEVLGAEAFDAAFREYIRRWAYKHPQPADFFRTMEDVSGQDLDWFWREWIYGGDVLDLAVGGVTQTRGEDGSYTVQVPLSARTSMVMPADLRLVLENGETRDVSLPAEVWYGGREYTYQARLPAPVAGVMLDPGNALPDQNRTNNAWGSARAAD